jgi:hypothetical protein
MNSLEIIKDFESKSPGTKNKILKQIKGLLKTSGLVRPSDDRVYKEVVNSYTTWKNIK